MGFINFLLYTVSTILADRSGRIVDSRESGNPHTSYQHDNTRDFSVE
jgi:hypothetical protein